MKILKKKTVFLGYEKESCFYKKKNHNFIGQINFLQAKVINYIRAISPVSPSFFFHFPNTLLLQLFLRL